MLASSRSLPLPEVLETKTRGRRVHGDDADYGSWDDGGGSSCKTLEDLHRRQQSSVIFHSPGRSTF